MIRDRFRVVHGMSIELHPRTLETLSHDRIDIEFVSTPEMSSFQFEAIVFLEWRNGGLVTYSYLEVDCFQGENSIESEQISEQTLH